MGSRGRRGGAYPNPFFDQASLTLPTNIKEMFRFCKWAFYSHELVSPIIRKLAEYPITEVQVHPIDDPNVTDEAAEETVKAWEKLFNKDLKIKSFLIDMAFDYYCYGNSFILPIFERDYYYRCTGGCGRTYSPDSKQLKISGHSQSTKKFKAECPDCGGVKELKLVTKKRAKVTRLKLLRLTPTHFDIEYNPLTGESIYFYTIPAKIRAKVLEGDPDYLAKLDPVFINAALTGGKLKFKKNKLFHLAAPGLAEEDQGWAKPPLMPVLKAIYHMAVLRRAEEAIMLEHAVPLRILYPQGANGMNPAEMINLSRWQQEVSEWIQVWKLDNNAIPFSNLPVGVANIGGDARGLLLTPELEYLKLLIINGMSCPREFIEGGLSYSGSSMSLRMLENHFNNFRETMEVFLSWLKEAIMAAMGMADVSVQFKRLKMADDVQKTNMAIALMGQGMLSKKTVLSDLDYNFEEERRQIQLEADMDNEMKSKSARAAADSQAETSITMAKAQVRAQYEQSKVQEALQDEETGDREAEEQSKRRELMRSMQPQALIQFVMAGSASAADVISLYSDKKIPPQAVPQLIDGIKGLVQKTLASRGVNPETLDGLPPKLSTKISNNVMSPVEVARAIDTLKAQQAQEAAQQTAQAGGPPQPGGGGQPPQDGGGAKPPGNDPAAEQQAHATDLAKGLATAKTPQEKALIESKIKAEGLGDMVQQITAQHQQAEQKPEPEQRPPTRDGGQHMS